jgi:hypothetical protein
MSARLNMVKKEGQNSRQYQSDNYSADFFHPEPGFILSFLNTINLLNFDTGQYFSATTNRT